jgi:ribosomal protein S15P/S13E
MHLPLETKYLGSNNKDAASLFLEDCRLFDHFPSHPTKMHSRRFLAILCTALFGLAHLLSEVLK